MSEHKEYEKVINELNEEYNSLTPEQKQIYNNYKEEYNEIYTNASQGGSTPYIKSLKSPKEFFSITNQFKTKISGMFNKSKLSLQEKFSKKENSNTNTNSSTNKMR